jgi:hypothetical protein
MKKNILFLFLFLSQFVFSCECPTIQPISKSLCSDYDVIFYGKVDSVNACSDKGRSTAYFTIIELYKGSVEQHVKVDFDCLSSCLISFAKDEEWLMYTKFQRFDFITVNLCSHSRKKFNNATQDFYFVSAQRTFDQEQEFLKQSVGIQSFAQNNKLNEAQADLKPRNEQPTGWGKLWLLLISFATMALVYFFSRQKK